jgi:hypothetical protein
MVHFENSYQYGKIQEKKVHPIIQDFFNRDIKMNPERYAKYDFQDEEFQYELKSRTNKLNTYPDTMITFNKITDEKPLILLFNYTDCLAYIEYEKELFSKFRKGMFSRANIDIDEKEHVFIPIEHLKIIKLF